jgi:multidrug efflux pump subunit AcrB
MGKLVEYFIKYPVSANIVILLIFFMGWQGLSGLNSTLMPQIDPGVIQISIAYPGASPEEIETGIVQKIENSLKSVSNLKEISSVSRENSGMLTIEIVSGADPDLVLQDVKNTVDQIASFPSGMETPLVKKIEWINQAIEFSLSGDVSLRDLKSVAQQVEDELLALPGISKLSIAGYPEEEIEIAIAEETLQANHLSMSQVAAAVSKANLDMTGGLLKGAEEEIYIRARQKDYYAKELGEIVVRGNAGELLRLEDIARISEKWADLPNRVYVNHEPAVLITVKHTADEDVVGIAATVREYLSDFESRYPGISASTVRDSSESIETMQEILVQNGLVGFVLVILFLSLFLNRRLSFWVAFSIPLSFLGMFLFALMADITLNRISMFGMIIVIGILVDDGIVIAENIYQHYERGKKAIRAAIDGTLEVLPAVFSGVLTTMVAFSSFLFIDGTFGQFFREMAVVVVAALGVSLVEAALILPAHIAHSKALKVPAAENVNIFTRFLSWLRDRLYAPALRFSLRHNLILISIVTGLFIITIGGIRGGLIRMNESATENTNYAVVNLEMPAGSTEAQTMEILNRLEMAAESAGDYYSQKAGKELMTSLNTYISSNTSGSVTLQLIDSEERSVHTTEILSRIQKNMGAVPEAQRLEYAETSYFGKPVELSLLSSNPDELERARQILVNELNALEGLRDVIDNRQPGNREINVTLKDNAYHLGLDLQNVMGQIRNGFYGYEVQRLNRGKDEVKIWVRYTESDRQHLENLKKMEIRGVNGEKYPLSAIAELSLDQSVLAINHKYGKREVTVSANLKSAAVDISAIRAEINTRILPEIYEACPSVSIESGGHSQRQKELLENIKIVLPMVLTVLLAIIAFTFRSILQAFLILALLPLSLIGIGWGHAIHGQAIDMPSYLGIIALIGVMVNDAIVFIGAMNTRLRGGAKFNDALFEAGISRFRPILLTSLTTMAGLAPLIFTNSSVARMLVPMAISVAYGVAISTLLTLFVLPVMLQLINGMRRRFAQVRTGILPEPEAVEQAVRELEYKSML